MAKTANAYVSDRGQVQITLSAANITAHSEFTTAEAIVIDGVVRSFQRTNNPQLPQTSTKVTGDTDPINVVGGGKTEAELWELVIVDDWTADYDGGEWGTDNLSAYQLLWTLHNGAATPSHPGGLAVAPNGDSTGKIEYTLVEPKLMSVGFPAISADADTPNEITILFSSTSHSIAEIS